MMFVSIDLCLVPIGVGTSLSSYIKECIEIIISANSDQPSLLHRPRNLQQQIKWRLLINPECHYYEPKNKAASVAKGEIIIFVDSDVIPDNQLFT